MTTYPRCIDCGMAKVRNTSPRCRSCSWKLHRSKTGKPKPGADERNDQILDEFTNQHLSMWEIAERHGVTRQRIYQILSRMLPGRLGDYVYLWQEQERRNLLAQATNYEDFLEQTGMSLDAARQWLNKRHLKAPPTRRRLAELERQAAIVADYRAGAAVASLTAKYNVVSDSAIYHVLNRYNVPRHQPTKGNGRRGA